MTSCRINSQLSTNNSQPSAALYERWIKREAKLEDAASRDRTREMILPPLLTILHFTGRAGGIRIAGNYYNSSDTLFRSIGTYFAPNDGPPSGKGLIAVAELVEPEDNLSDRPIKTLWRRSGLTTRAKKSTTRVISNCLQKTFDLMK